jgi:hypothetical protein
VERQRALGQVLLPVLEQRYRQPVRALLGPWQRRALKRTKSERTELTQSASGR